MFSNTTHGRNTLNLLFRLQNILKTTSYYCNTKYRKKPKYGSRFLTPNSDIFLHNAWYVNFHYSGFFFSCYIFFRDDVQWDEEQEKEAMKKVQLNSEIKFNKDVIEKYEKEASLYWDEFYNIHINKFFKDRHWLFTEFPELASENEEKQTIFEIGCGVGNTIFPILQYSTNKNLYIYGSDFSSNAINILKGTPEYDEKRCNAFVLDATEENWIVPFQTNSIDIVILIFVLSAINPGK